MYTKIVKYISWALLLIGVVIGVLGFIIGFNTNDAVAVDTLLYWAYVMVGLAIASIIVVGIIVGAMTNPKGLVKTGIVVLVAAVIVAGAYFLAPGSEPVGYNGVPETYGWLKLTDTMLNLTYLSCVAAILSVIVGAIVSAVRK